MSMLLWGIAAVLASDVAALGILKAAEQGGCAQAWLMPTSAQHPTPYCLDFSRFSAGQRTVLETYYDEEVWIEGSYTEGAVALLRIDPVLGPANRGPRPALDYHISAVPFSRSHDISRRLQDNAVTRLRIQTPASPISIEFIFQGVTTRDQLPVVLEALTFTLSGQPLVPETRSFGKTVVLVIPEVKPQQLLSIESAGDIPIRDLLSERLFSGSADQMSLTMLLSAL